MPASPEHLPALRDRERLWRSDAVSANGEATSAAGLTEHRAGAPEAGVAEFAGHPKATLAALSRLPARYELAARDRQRLAAPASTSFRSTCPACSTSSSLAIPAPPHAQVVCRAE